MDSAFERPEYGVSSAFVYCLWMIWSGFFKFSEEALNRIYESELYDKISRELSSSDIPDGPMPISRSQFLS